MKVQRSGPRSRSRSAWRTKWRALECGAVLPRIDDELDLLVEQLRRRCVMGAEALSGASRITVSPDPDRLAEVLHAAAARQDSLTVIDVTGDVGDLDQVGRLAVAAEAPLVSLGWVRHPFEPARAVAVVGPSSWANPEPAPASFSVAAIMFAYNEADIIRPSIEQLVQQGIEVYLVDNCSTDGTADLVTDLVGHGVIAIDRFPAEGRSDQYDWSGLLRHGEKVSDGLPHDWCVVHDVDEVRDSAWPATTYRDGFYNADRLGFNAVDHTIFQFRPTDDDFIPGQSFSDHIRHFELVPGARVATNVKAWRNSGRVDLASTGGHEARFDDRSVFPLNFTLRHYPVRSQRHGETKIFRDRQPRYPESELAKGWHYHYSRIRRGHDFLYQPGDLERYDPDTFDTDFLLPRLARLGIPVRDHGIAGWARSTGVSVLSRVGLLRAASNLKDRMRS